MTDVPLVSSGLREGVSQLTADALDAGLDEIRRSPRDEGRLTLIVRRPTDNEREVLAEAVLDLTDGLVGDNWRVRPRDAPLTVMNSRAAALIAGTDDRRSLAGDQLYVDFDLSEANVPVGTRLEVGSAMIEVLDKPHLGCRKFSERFGRDAVRFVNGSAGRELRLRGLNARIIVAGVIREGDTVRKQLGR